MNNYEKYNWMMFDPNQKKERRENVFPQERQAAFALGADMLNNK